MCMVRVRVRVEGASGGCERDRARKYLLREAERDARLRDVVHPGRAVPARPRPLPVNEVHEGRANHCGDDAPTEEHDGPDELVLVHGREVDGAAHERKEDAVDVGRGGGAYALPQDRAPPALVVDNEGCRDEADEERLDLDLEGRGDGENHEPQLEHERAQPDA